MIMKLEEDKLKCVFCKGWAEPSRFQFMEFYVRGWVCPKCGEKIINSEDAGKILAINKLAHEKKLTAKIAKVGNSFVFRIPKEVIVALGLKDKEVLNMSISNPKLISFAIP
jgi:hypothetical protein